MLLNFTGKFSNFETFTFGLEVKEGVQYIVKIEGTNGALEYKGVGTGACDGHTIDLTQLTPEQRNALNKVIIFIDYENAAATEGEFFIHWAGLEGFKYAGVGAVEYNGEQNSPDMAAIWSPFGTATCYTLERPKDQPWEVKYNKTADDATYS